MCSINPPESHLAISPLDRIFKLAFTERNGIGQWEDDRPWVQLDHFFDNLLSKSSLCGGETKECRRLGVVDNIDQVFKRRSFIIPSSKVCPIDQPMSLSEM
jgi:hypothetical protein